MTELFRVVWAADGSPVTHADLERLAGRDGQSWAQRLIWCDMEGFAIEQDGALLLLDECGNYAYPPEGLFRVEWSRDHHPLPAASISPSRTPAC